MFKLVRRDGARENSGHFESLGHNGNAYNIGQVVTLDGGKAMHWSGPTSTVAPYGIVARRAENTDKEVIVLRITNDMEFETLIATGTTALVPGMAVPIHTGGTSIQASALGSSAKGVIVADTLGAKAAGDKVIVRFNV